jgi:hypothetical protein
MRILIGLFILMTSLGVQAQTVSSGLGSGNWNDPLSWTPNIVPVFNNTTSITILAGHTITVTAPVTIDQTIIQATGAVIINPGVTLSVNNGGSTDLLVNGALTVNGTLMISGGGNNVIIFNNASLVNNGTITHTSGTFNLNGTTAVTGTPVSTSIFNVASSGGSTATSSINMTINGNLGGTGQFTSSATTTFAGTTLVTGGGNKTFNDVTITGSVSASTNVNLFVTGNFTNNGTLNFTSGRWTFSGAAKSISGSGPLTNFFNVTISGTIFNIIPLSVDGALTVSSSGNLTAFGLITGVGTITVNGILTANVGLDAQGALTVTSAGSSMTSSSVPFTVGGLLTVSGGGVLSANAGFDAAAGITVTGAGSSMTVSNAPFTVAGTLNTTASGTFTTNSSASGTISGNMAGTGVFTANGLVTFDSNTQFSGSGAKNFNNVIVSATGTLTSTGTVTLSIAGDLTNNGTINLTSGTLGFTGTSNNIQGTPVSTTFFNIAINNNAAITASIPFTALGTINITSSIPIGTLTTNSPFTVGGTLTVGGNLNSNAGFTANGAVTVTATTGSLQTATASFSVAGTLTINGFLTANAGFSTAGTVTVNNTGSLTANTSPFSIGGLFTVNGPVIANAGADLTLSGASNFAINTGGTFTSSVTVIFNGTTTLTGSAAANARNFTNLRVNSGQSLNGVEDFIVGGNIENNGGTINLTGGTVTFASNGSLSGTGLPTTTFNNFIINTGNTLNISTFPSLITITSDLTLNGNLNHTATNIISIGDDQLGTTGNLSSLGTIRFAGTTSAFTVGGTKSFTNLTVGDGVGADVLSVGANSNFSIDGILSVANGCTLNAGTGSSTVTFGNGLPSTTSSITGSGTINFDGLTIASGHTLTSSSGTIELTADLTNSGSFNHNSGTVLFRTAGVKNITGNSTTFNNITVGSGVGSTTVINSMAPLNLRGRLTLNTTVVNTFTTGNNLVLLSTSDNPADDATIGPLRGTALAVLNGTYTAQRYMSSENRIWRYIASPVVGSNVAQLKAAFPVSGTFSDPSACPLCPPTPAYNPASPSLYYYNAPTQAYVAYPTSGTASANLLLNGRGYSAFVRQDGLTGPATINFTGTHPATPALATGLPLTVAAAANGSSLIGNPYPSAIIWDPANASLYPNTTNIVTTAKVRNNGTGGPVFVDVLPGETIAAGQSFWVTTSASGGGVLNINENAKVASSTTNFYRIAADEVDELVINMYKPSTGVSDITRLRVQDGSLTSLDNFDAEKWDNKIQGGANQFDLSTITADDKSVSTNSVPSLSCSQQINLKLTDLLFDADGNPEASANYVIDFNPAGAFSSLVWTLHDKAANGGSGADINVTTNSSYNFTVDNAIPATQASDRFYLVISAQAINQSVGVTAVATVCEGTNSVITLTGSQDGMTYGAEVNGQSYTNLAKGNGSDLLLELDDQWLTNGTNVVKIIANSGCVQSFLTSSVSIDKNNLYQVGSVVDASLCKTSSAVLTATGAPGDGSYRWYATEQSSTVLGTEAQFTTPTISENSNFYVTVANAQGCEGNRVPVKVLFVDLNQDLMVISSADQICKGNSLTFSAGNDLSGGSFNWYDSETASTPLFSGPEFTTPVLNESKVYFVAYTTVSGCEGDRQEVMANVANFNPILKANPVTSVVCEGTSHVFTVSGAAGSTYQWFDSIDSTQPIAEGEIFETPPLSSSQNYFVRAMNSLGCSSDKRLVEGLVDSSNPIPNFNSLSDEVCKNSVGRVSLTALDANNKNYRWYESESSVEVKGEGLEFTTDLLDADKTYYVGALNANGCEGTERKSVDVKVKKLVDAVIEDSSLDILSASGQDAISLDLIDSGGRIINQMVTP